MLTKVNNVRKKPDSFTYLPSETKQKENFFSKTFASVEHVTNIRRHLIESYIKVLPLEFKRH